LHRDEIGCTFSLGRKFKTEIPGEHAADRASRLLGD
jgi:hypothetical protein